MFFDKSVKQFTKKLFRQGAKNLLAEITEKKTYYYKNYFLKTRHDKSAVRPRHKKKKCYGIPIKLDKNGLCDNRTH